MWGIFRSLFYLILGLIIVIIAYVAYTRIVRIRAPELEVDLVGEKYVVVCTNNCSGELVAEDGHGRIVFREVLREYETYEVPASAQRLYVATGAARYVFELGGGQRK